jgi:hypothetical protein
MSARAKLLPFLISVALTGCATAEDELTSQEETPLTVEVERVEVARGVLRLDARTENGSADLTVTLGGGCEKKGTEIGRGIATGAHFAWSFTSDELADVLACGAIAIDARHGGAHRRAVLGASMDLFAVGDDTAPSFLGREDRKDATVLTFQGVAHGARLEAGDTSVDAEPREGENSSFVVPFAALSRAFVTRAPLAFDGQPALGVDVAIAGSRVGDGVGIEEPPIDEPECEEEE